MAVGDKVLAIDFNYVRNLAVNLAGNGSATRGYGQQTFSPNQYSTIDKISPTGLDEIRQDLLNIRAHQIGTNPAISVVASTGNLVTETDKINFTNLVNSCDTDRFTAHSSRISTSSPQSSQRTTSWRSEVVCTLTQTFVNSDTARFFYNGGGRVRITSSRSGGASTSQNASWTNVLSTAGTQIFSAGFFYSLTSSYQNFYIGSGSSPYASNRYRIDALCNVSNNSSGGATSVTWRMQFTDPYNDPGPPAPGDVVDGTLTVQFDNQYPTGGSSLTPSGSWRGFVNSGSNGIVYTLPSYSLSSITGS